MKLKKLSMVMMVLCTASGLIAAQQYVTVTNRWNRDNRSRPIVVQRNYETVGFIRTGENAVIIHGNDMRIPLYVYAQGANRKLMSLDIFDGDGAIDTISFAGKADEQIVNNPIIIQPSSEPAPQAPPAPRLEDEKVRASLARERAARIQELKQRLQKLRTARQQVEFQTKRQQHTNEVMQSEIDERVGKKPTTPRKPEAGMLSGKCPMPPQEIPADTTEEQLQELIDQETKLMDAAEGMHHVEKKRYEELLDTWVSR